MKPEQQSYLTRLLGRFALLVACGWAAAGLARADTWTLRNGDRITGELIEEGAEVIEVKHAQLGRLSLPRSALQPVVAADPATATDGDALVSAAKPAAATKKPRWKRQIDIGFSQQSGTKSKEDLTVRGQFDGRIGANTYRGTARLLQAESQDKVITDRHEADFRWRHEVTKRLFTQTQTTYAVDDVRQIELSVEQQVGGGYKVLDAPRHQANVGVGAVFQYLDREGFDPSHGLLASFFQDYAYTLNSRIKLTQETNVLVSDSSTFALQGGKPGLSGTAADGAYRVKFNAAVQSKVTPEVVFNVRFEYDYDHSVADAELRADQRLTTSLGYVW